MKVLGNPAKAHGATRESHHPYPQIPEHLQTLEAQKRFREIKQIDGISPDMPALL